MSELLFVYGTLQDPIIQMEVVGKTYIGEPDILENHEISQNLIIDGTFPIIKESVNKNVGGLVLDILLADFLALDEYEGEPYNRVKVKLKSGRLAWVYK